MWEVIGEFRTSFQKLEENIMQRLDKLLEVSIDKGKDISPNLPIEHQILPNLPMTLEMMESTFEDNMKDGNFRNRLVREFPLKYYNNVFISCRLLIGTFNSMFFIVCL